MRERAAAHGRAPEDVRVLQDLVVVLAPDAGVARERLALLRDSGVGGDGSWAAQAGTVGELALELRSGVASGAVDGYVLRPASLGSDLDALLGGVVPLLQDADAFRRAYPGATLRDTLGLTAAAKRLARA